MEKNKTFSETALAKISLLRQLGWKTVVAFADLPVLGKGFDRTMVYENGGTLSYQSASKAEEMPNFVSDFLPKECF